jgi:hypothetical protein
VGSQRILLIATKAYHSYAVASLSAEVKRYQDAICHTCRETVIRATLAKAAHPPTSSGLTLTASQPTAHPSIILSESTGATVDSSDSGPTSAIPSFQASEPSFPVASSSGVHSPRPRRNNPGGSVAAATSSGTPVVVAHLPISIYSADPNSEPSQLRVPSEAAGPTQAKPDDLYQIQSRREISCRGT